VVVSGSEGIREGRDTRQWEKEAGCVREGGRGEKGDVGEEGGRDAAGDRNGKGGCKQSRGGPCAGGMGGEMVA